MNKKILKETNNFDKTNYATENMNTNPNNDILRDAVANGIIDMETVQKELDVQVRGKILREHAGDIWQGKNTKKWYTYLPDEEKGRIQKERNTKEEIEDLIVAFYWPEGAYKAPKTLEELFPEWYEYKAKTGTADSYIRKIYDMWKVFYKDDPIVKKKLSGLDRFELEKWAHALIEKHDMDKKRYYNVTCIIRQSLAYAVQKGYIVRNPFSEFTMSPKYFRKDKKKPDDTQVFMTDEQPKVEKACWDKFYSRPMFTSPLAILLHFKTGLRVGEMVALRESDIEGDYIHVQRQQVSAYELETVDGELRPVYKGFKIVEHAKTNAGDRYVYLTPEAKKIIALVLESNETYGHHCEDFLFVNKDRVLLETTIIHKLYAVCEKAGIPRKSTHKIRKTFVSALIDADVNINTIRKTVGHERESTTLSSYTYDRHTTDEVAKKFTDTLDR